MTTPPNPKISVHIDVVVDGCGQSIIEVTPKPIRVPSPEGPKRIAAPFSSPADTPVTGANKCIDASGDVEIRDGHSATAVWVKLYPSIETGATFTPAMGAVQATITAGVWSFSGTNCLPGAKCDAVSGGPNNNTLIVWHEFPNQSFTIEFRYFHGYCPPASSRQTLPSLPPGPTTLLATFTGALCPLATVPLSWSGVSWIGYSSHAGGAVFNFTFSNSAYQLLGMGPAANIVAAGPVASSGPFNWSAAGLSFGALGGPFQVTITE